MTARPSQPASVQERVLQRVREALEVAGTAAGTYVFRGRVEAHGISELPAINVRRSVGLSEPLGQGVDVVTIEFEVDHLVAGDDWETTADALHVEAHAALAGDAQLAQMVSGLRCIRTDLRAAAGDETRGLLTATYQAKSAVSVADLSNSDPFI